MYLAYCGQGRAESSTKIKELACELYATTLAISENPADCIDEVVSSGESFQIRKWLANPHYHKIDGNCCGSAEGRRQRTVKK